MKHSSRLVLLALFLTCSQLAIASPIIAPGSSQLRHDITLLSDAGIITGPISSWPLPWAQISTDLAAQPKDASYTPSVAAALARVRWQLSVNKSSTQARPGAYVRGGTEPQFLRSFDDTPRGDAEAGVYLDWNADRFAGRIEVQYVVDPEDGDEEVRLDGSWLGVALGNWMLAAGQIDRYWGPAWQGGLIMSNNARPRPGVSLSRLRSTPFETKWLSWIGPWSLTFFTDVLEGNRAVSNALVTGLRISFRPVQSLEIGLSRTAQYGGEGNDVGFGTIADVITGQSNQTNPSIGGGTNINQLGGGDIRWKLPLINAAIYGEAIGEDEKGGRPFQILGQAGAETWGGLGNTGASWRLIYEFANTQADLFKEANRQPNYGTAYNNFEFASGYRYRGRTIGHPADGDALVHSVRGVVVSRSGHEFRAVATAGVLNRGGVARNGLTQRREDVAAIDLGYGGQYRWGRLDVGLGFTDRDFDGGSDQDTHFWAGVGREFN